MSEQDLKELRSELEAIRIAIQAMRVRVDILSSAVEDLIKTQRELVKVEVQAKTGIRVLAWVGGLAVGAGAIGKFLWDNISG